MDSEEFTESKPKVSVVPHIPHVLLKAKHLPTVSEIEYGINMKDLWRESHSMHFKNEVRG